ncbi:LmbU family transcriptional regulator [Streptomyces sp. NPDC057638]|uniref:LmbU family transcriptional regulator n=1 Tax=Streptomyces sp. NPDC057638 TaxID=3346190 RepID=UPI0036A0F022
MPVKIGDNHSPQAISRGHSIQRTPQPSTREAATDAAPPAPKAPLSTCRTALDLPADMSLERWKSVGRHIFVISDSSGWWLGDWLIYGQAHYPQRYKAAIADTSLSYQTLRNYAWIAGRFPVGRRHSGLSFQHHAEVASLDEGEQDRWLGLAASSGWSRNELRRHVRESRGRAHERPQRRTPAAPRDAALRTGRGAIQFRLSSERRIHWEKAAANEGLELSAWILAVLDGGLEPACPSVPAVGLARPIPAGRALAAVCQGQARDQRPFETSLPQHRTLSTSAALCRVLPGVIPGRVPRDRWETAVHRAASAAPNPPSPSLPGGNAPA